MKRLSIKMLASALTLTLLGFVAPATAMAATVMPTGDKTTPEDAVRLESVIKQNDKVRGPVVTYTAGGPCPYADVSSADRLKVMTALNAIRELAHVDPVTMVPSSDAIWHQAQEGAISMTLTGWIAHGLGPKYICKTQGGVDTTRGAVLALNYDGVPVTQYMHDGGVPSLGHRSQLINPTLEQFSVGVASSTARTSTMSIQTLRYLNSAKTSAPPVLAWPAAGYFPQSLEPWAWSFSAAGLDPADVTVSVTLNGKPVTVTDVDAANPQPIYWAGGEYDLWRTVSFQLPERSTSLGLNETADYMVTVTSAGKSWTYPVNVFNKLDIHEPRFDVDLPASYSIPEGGRAEIPFVITGFPKFSYALEILVGSSWMSYDGGNNAVNVDRTMVVSSTFRRDGDRFRIVAKSGGKTYTSREMTLHIVPQPAAKVTYSSWADGAKQCSTRKVTQTRVQTTTPYIWNTTSQQWVLNTAKATKVTQTQYRDMVDAEIKACTPQPAPVYSTTYSPIVDSTDAGAQQCSTFTVAQTRTRTNTVTPYVWNSIVHEWRLGTPQVTTATLDAGERAMTQTEKHACGMAEPGSTPVTARVIWQYFGSKPWEWIGSGWMSKSITHVFNAGDLDGNGYDDMMLTDTKGLLWFYPAKSDTRFGSRKQVGFGWNNMTQIFGGVDFNGDGKIDILGVDKLGNLFLYPGVGTGRFAAKQKIHTDFGSVRNISVGQVGFNGNPIIMGSRGGILKAWQTDGKAHFVNTFTYGGGWDSMILTAISGDITGDGIPDMWAVSKSGELRVYAPKDRTTARFWIYKVGTGWSQVRDFLPRASKPRVVRAVFPDGVLRQYTLKTFQADW